MALFTIIEVNKTCISDHNITEVAITYYMGVVEKSCDTASVGDGGLKDLNFPFDETERDKTNELIVNWNDAFKDKVLANNTAVFYETHRNG